jgi:hypothetical protein
LEWRSLGVILHYRTMLSVIPQALHTFSSERP